MRIIAKSRIIQYGKKYGPDAHKQLLAWYQEAKEASWRTPQDITEQYKGADVVRGKFAIFNICGNRYRLIADVWFGGQEVYIKFFGNHAEYDKVNFDNL